MFENLQDISLWNEVSISVPGTRNKHILINPTDNRRFMFKLPKAGVKESLTELLADRLGEMWGFDVVRGSTLATYHREIGYLSPLLIDGDACQLIDAKSLFRNNEAFVGIDEISRAGFYESHTIENILALLQEDFFCAGSFSKMLIFDALINNGDRHWEN